MNVFINKMGKSSHDVCVQENHRNIRFKIAYKLVHHTPRKLRKRHCLRGYIPAPE